jgi:glycerophosphoryl diester phosphodiesterase
MAEPPFVCNYNDYHYSRLKIMDAIRNLHDETAHLTLVAAHRGYWRIHPENSRLAIREAGYCYEIVEADIKPAKDGPVVEHDLVLNRTTSGTGNLANITMRQFSELHLKNRHGVVMKDRVDTGMTAQELINYYDSLVDAHVPWAGYVLALDVKADKPEDVWPQIRFIYDYITKGGYGSKGRLGDSILYKIEARSMPSDPTVIDRLLAAHPGFSLNICIVLNPDDSTNQSVIDKYRGKPYIATYEVNYRYNGSSMDRYLFGNLPGAIGTFSTYYDLPTGVGTSKGICCSTLNTDTSGEKVIDYRARWDWYLTYSNNNMRAFSVVTSDRPDLLIPYLQSNGLRDTRVIDK